LAQIFLGRFASVDSFRCANGARRGLRSVGEEVFSHSGAPQPAEVGWLWGKIKLVVGFWSVTAL
jgi:hypothetical protein